MNNIIKYGKSTSQGTGVTQEPQLYRPKLSLNDLWYLVSEKELQKLYKNFSKIDKDKSGMLEPEEFFDIPGKFLYLN